MRIEIRKQEIEITSDAVICHFNLGRELTFLSSSTVYYGMLSSLSLSHKFILTFVRLWKWSTDKRDGWDEGEDRWNHPIFLDSIPDGDDGTELVHLLYRCRTYTPPRTRNLHITPSISGSTFPPSIPLFLPPDTSFFLQSVRWTITLSGICMNSYAHHSYFHN